MQTRRATLRPSFGWINAALDLCNRHKGWSIGGSLALASLVALADLATGDQFPLIACYLPSVMVTCWIGHVAIGATLASVCSLAWLLDDLLGLRGEELLSHELWTATVHGFFFLIVISMLNRLRQAHENERLLARTDGLTGLLNAKAFRERADEEIVRVARTGRGVSVAFIDCDNFKTVNDTLGHLEGDRLLTAIAEKMTGSVRAMDICARMGGDEFAILLPETAEEDAQFVVDRLHADLNARMQAADWPVTFSIGVAVYSSPPESVDALIHGADKLMYEVKTGAKDAVVLKLVA